jgi:hypothetical protein
MQRIALRHDDSRCVEVANLLSRSLRIPAVSRHVSTKTIHAALDWINQDGVDPATQGHAILTALSGALFRIADVDLLGRLSERLLEYLTSNPEAEHVAMSYLEAMGERADELIEKTERKQQPAISGNKKQKKPEDASSRQGGGSSTWFSDLLGEALLREDDASRP